MNKWAWVAIGIFLIFQLRGFNLAVSYLDEGQLIHDAQRIIAGQIPYKDFSLVLTPGTYYLMALVLRIFGNYVILGRILFIIVQILLIYLGAKLFPLSKYQQIIYLLSMGILLVWPGGFIMYNFLGILVIMVCLYLMTREKYLQSGVLAGLIFIIKQTFGLTVIPILFLVMLIYSRKLKDWNGWIFGLVLSLGLFFGYLAINAALPQFINYAFIQSAAAKSAQASFILHRLIAALPIVIILAVWKNFNKTEKTVIVILGITGACIYLGLKPARIGRLLTYLPDITFWLYSFYYLLPLYVIGKFQKYSKFWVCAALVALSTFLGLAASGYSRDMIWFVTILYLPLILITKPFGKFVTSLLILVILLATSFNPLNPPKHIFRTYPISQINVYSQIPSLKYIKLAAAEEAELHALKTLVQNNTTSRDKIFCFPYCPLIYPIVERENASEFSLFYFETFSKNDQQKVINELISQKPKLIILQKRGYIEGNPESAYSKLPLIKNYISNNWNLAYSTNEFEIYTSPSN